ncbi:hypothetical protein ARAM_001732 [Aspergillus rambellii]|uniref:CMP/dCMP-type deaminase domain-containing protein n=1 Tax=Aspergillus rambellii TaxID=308745 RepID=A0A0F8U1U3_9EURO|nr:hypothetical protein ARAM_001732 [Aspergillus rambellii]
MLAPFVALLLFAALFTQASWWSMMIIAQPQLAINSIPFTTRVYWMRRANAALAELSDSPCPFAAFGSVIVNHTGSTGLGNLICIAVNENSRTGNPSMHGEIAAINNCTAILTDPNGRFRLSPAEAQDAFADLTIYTNAESCPMCASAIRWSGFREYVYGTSIETLIQNGWGQIQILSEEVFEASRDLPSQSRLIGEILTNETDPYFLWQYNPNSSCPHGCHRPENGLICQAK